MQTTRYGYFRRLVHWAAALSVLGLLTVGMLFSFYSFEELQGKFGEANTAMLFQYHKSFGILVLIFGLLLLFMRRRGVPAYDPPLALLLRWPSRLVHWLLILSMIAMPILGWLATATGGFPVEFFDWTLPSLIPENKELSKQLFMYHGLVGWVLLCLVGIHLGAVIMHKHIAHDNINSRMSLF